jgi:hypothetical protein
MQVMETVAQKTYKIRKHVATHKAAYVAGAVAVAAIALQQRNIREFNAFLDEKGIDRDEYYCPEYYEEKQAIKEQLIEEIKTNY